MLAVHYCVLLLLAYEIEHWNQTLHQQNRAFWGNDVLKTGFSVNHDD